MIFLKIAFNNLFRNKRRAISTIAAIMIGITTMVFGNGISSGLAKGWSNKIINKFNGHFRVRHIDYEKYGTSDLEKVLIKDPESMIKELSKNQNIVEAMPRVIIGGFVNQENKSTDFFGYADDVSRLEKVLPDFDKMIVKGESLSVKEPVGAVLGKSLAESIDVTVGDELVLLSNSIYSETTAIIVIVKGLMEIKNKEVEQNLLIANIKNAYNLLDIEDGASEIVVRIDDSRNLEKTMQWVNQYFKKQNLPWIAEPWYNDPVFQKLTSMYNGVSVVTSIILSLIVSIVIGGAILISIFERTKEVGSMRAVGAEKKHIYYIFYIESNLVTFCGIVLGILCGTLSVLIAGYIGIDVPGATELLRPVLTFRNIALSSILPLIITMIVVIYPIKNSCKMNIIDAINYV